MDDARDRSPTRSRWSRADWPFVAVGLLMWLTLFNFPGVSSGLGLDVSWEIALAHFHAHGMRAGVDWIFTYGPLGFCDAGEFEPTQFWLRLVGWELVFEGAGICVLVCAARRLPQRWQAALFFALWFFVPSPPDAHWMLVVTALASLALASPRVSWPAYFAACAMASVVALVKFAWAPAALFAIACCAFARGRTRPRELALAAAAACAVFAAAWMFAGERLGDLPAYFGNSLEVTRGYAEAMSGKYAAGFAAWSAALAALGCAVAAASALQRPRSAARALLALLVIGASFVAYKASVVRHGPTGPFLAYLPLALCLLAHAGEARTLATARLACVALTVAVGVAFQDGLAARLEATVLNRAILWAYTADDLVHVPRELAELNGQLENERSTFAMPRITEVVGDAPVDFLGDAQALVLRNSFVYRPRPVFQSYVAYSPKLAAINERFYAGPDAPAFVVQSLPSTDEQLAGGLDSGALSMLFQRYEPVLVEHGFALWKRVDGEPAPVAARAPASARTGRIGEWSEVADESAPCRWLRLDLRWTLAGRVARDLAHPPRPRLEMRTTSGVVSRRFVPSLVREGALVDPVLRHQWDLMRWVARDPVPQLLALRVVLEDGDRGAFEPEFAFELSPRPELAPRSPPNARVRFAYSMFATAPSSVKLPDGAFERVVHNRAALFVLAPSEMRFAVEPGEHTIRGVFGVGVEQERVEATDGVRFEIGVGEQPPLLSQTLDPAHVTEDRRARPFRFSFTVDAPSEIWLRTDPGQSGDARWDDAYWLGISLDGDVIGRDADGEPRKKRDR